MKLVVELVPKSTWYNNLRSILSKQEWDMLRKAAYASGSYRCGVCHEAPDSPLECHEIWHYDDENKVQSLHGLIALCKDCHRVKHAGLANIRGESKLVIAQLMKVNNITEQQALSHLQQAFKIWKQRSQYTWSLNVEKVKEYLQKQKP